MGISAAQLRPGSGEAGADCVGFVVAQYPQQVGLIPDEGAVQELAAASPDPAYGDRVHAGRPHVAKHGADASGGEDRVERGGEVHATVADHEFDPVCLVAEIHEEVAGLLGGPLSGGMQGDPGDADAVGRVLDHGQDIVLGAVKQVDREEVAGRDGPVCRRAESMPLAFRISHTVDAATLTRGRLARRGSSVPSSGFSRAGRRISARMLRRVVGRPVLARMVLAAQRRRTMSRCQRTIVSG